MTVLPDRPFQLPRHRTGRPELDQRLVELLDAIGVTDDRDQIFEILATAVRLAGDDVDRLDLKIVNAALKEMRNAFRIFAPYNGVPKVTIFGSARTHVDDPEYVQTRDVARRLAELGWMVVTGAGPGIMADGMEGAGIERAIGVSIRLPFEQEATEFVADDRLVTMKYFFTRKLMLVKESHAFISLPGGFGTLDETFELLTLVQTGKMVPVPIVMLDIPGGTYWAGFRRFIDDQLAARGLVGETDVSLFTVTDSMETACDVITAFYANFQSMRWVGDRLVIRLQRAPDAVNLARLNDDFAFLCASGGIEITEPLTPERLENDAVDRARIVLRYNRRHIGKLRLLIDALNRW